MTTVVDRLSSTGAPSVAPPVPAVGPRPRRRRGLLAPLLVGVAALALRLIAITRSYDLFVDEITYATIGRNLAHGAGLSLYGRPFTLHPPAAFALYGAAIRIFGISGNLDHVIMSLRPVSAVLGAIGCVGAWFLVDRIAGRRAATIAAVILALDPFTISYDSLVMLEAPAGAFSIATMALLVAAAGEPEGRRRGILVRLAGLSAAVVVTTKDTFGLIVGLTILTLLVTGWVLRRREALLMGSLTAAGYGILLAGLALTGDIGSWWSSNVDGLLRLVGADQQTGFNAPSVHVSITSRAFADLGQTATSYLILGVGPIAALALLLHLRPWRADWQGRATGRQRGVLAVAVWALIASGYISYATLFGSIEEQMYYILLTPALAATVAAAVTIPAGRRLARLRLVATHFHGPAEAQRRRIAAILDSEAHRDASETEVWEKLLDRGVYLCSVSTMQEVRTMARPRRRVTRQRVIAVVATLVVTFNAFIWVRVHTTAADRYNRFLAWESTHVPYGSTMSVTDGLAEFLLNGLTLGDWDTRAGLVRHHVEYVLVSERLVLQGYEASVPFLDLLQRRGRLVYSSGPSIRLELYNVQSLTGAR